MISTTIPCLLVVLLSLTVNTNCQTCEYISQYGACSTNSGCGCLHLTFADNVGVCGLLSLSCSRFVACQSPSDTCEQSDHICVRHPQCSSSPLCFPLAMVDQRLCPPLTAINTTRPETTVISNCSGALTFGDGVYNRPGSSGNYYEAIQIMVGTSGTYNLTSLSGIDTHGYLYNGTFYPTNPPLNQINHNDDGAANNQFLLTQYLEAGVPYTLVVTTHSGGNTGAFSVISSGPDDVYCIALAPMTSTTSTTTTTTSTTTPIFNAMYSGALTVNSSSYGRGDNSSGTYYYQAIEVRVDTTGTYTFTSAALSMDTYGYLYQGNFYPSYPSLNIVAQDDDSAGSGQFRLTATLRSDITYILVFTTFGEHITGPISVNATGPGRISLTPIN